MVVLNFFWYMYFSNSEVKWHDVWQRNIYIPIISDDVFVFHLKNISRNHNLCIKNYFYNPREIILSIFSGYFVKSNTKFKMCVHMIVFYSHTGSKRVGGTWCGLY